MPIFGLGRKKKSTTAPAAPAQTRKPVVSLPGLPQPRLVVDNGDPELTALLATAASRDWPAVRAVLAGYSGHDQSSLATSLCDSVPDIGEWLPRDQTDPLVQALLGIDAVERAWRVRTGKLAKYVSQDQFREFHQILGTAEEFFYASVELDPAGSTPWFGLLASGMGLSLDLDAQRRRFDALVERAPGHLGGHRRMLQKVCAKWSGSHELMHAFALEAMRGPHGDVLGELVPQAYFEHWVQLPDKSPERAALFDEKARAELQEAADRSIFHPDYACPRGPYAAANRFGWAFTTAGMKPQARAAYEATGGMVVDWAGFRDPVAGYTATRNRAYQGV